MIKKNLAKTQSGVTINFTGELKKESVETMVEACREGNCGCDCAPTMMPQINKIAVSGEDGDVTITLHSDTLDIKSVEEAIEGCDITG
ncbi:MAG: hypothetical protein MUP09_08630 [Thiovulaceae bacterium]|nr:hypothetical protein [Sulfurimonadaceae bacterium]